MLRTPTHIVELGTNSNTTTTPLMQQLQQIHTKGSPATTVQQQYSKKQQQQQQSKLYHDHHYYQTAQYQFVDTIGTSQQKVQSSQKPKQNYTKEPLSKSILSSTTFSFKKIKKSKTTPTATTTAANNDFCCDTNQATRTAYITLTNSYNITNNNNQINNNYLTTVSATATATTTNTPPKTKSKSKSSSSSSSSSSTAYQKSSPASAAAASITSTASNSNSTSTTSSAAATLAAAAAAAAPTTAPTVASMSPTSQTPSRTSLFDSCHRKIRLIGGGPVAFLGGLVAKARRKERDGDQNSTDTKLYLEESVLERKLPEADLKALVDLPAGLDYNEWLASHTLALFEHVNLVYGTISEFCTPSGCPDMTGPGNRTYLWFDEKGKKTRVAAPQYIDYVMTFTQKTVSDESIFPTKYANEFPSSFESIARKILRLQFHVIAHLYAAHFREIALLGLHTHLNLTFAHLTALHRRFTLIDEKETDVLRDLEVALRLTDDSSSGSGGSSQLQAEADTALYNHAQQTTTTQLTAAAAASATNSQHHALGMVATAAPGCGGDDVNSTQTVVIDGDAAAPPICTQPEAATKSSTNAAAAVFGGGGGLIGGILGDLSSGEFGDTTRYCTSAVPPSSSSASEAATAAHCNNTGAGALHLNFNNSNSSSNNNNHHPHAHHHHHHHQHHHHQHHLHQQHQLQQLQQHQQNSGLIQCNASTGPNNASSSTTTTA